VALSVGAADTQAADVAPVMSEVSVGVIHPGWAWLSSNGRFALVSSRYDYYLHLYDRTTGVSWIPDLPQFADGLMVPDGSAVLATGFLQNSSGRARAEDLYRYELPNGPTRRISNDIDPSMLLRVTDSSADGRLAALELVPDDESYPNDHTRVVVLDTVTGAVDDVSELLPEADRRYKAPTISADGRYVAFSSHVGNCHNGCDRGAYVADRLLRTVERIDVAPDGSPPDAMMAHLELSADGRHALFFSRASNIVPAASGDDWALFVRDLADGTTYLVSDHPSYFAAWSAGISADGSKVLYTERAPTDDPPYDASQPVLFDRVTGTRTFIASGIGGAHPNGATQWAKITDDGRTVYFRSDASNLIPNGTSMMIYAWGPKPPAPVIALTPVMPRRVLETRSEPGAATIDGQFVGAGRRPAGSVLELTVAGRAGVPADATAAMLNVTAVNPSAAGFLTIYPCDSERPLAANVNYRTGDVVANAVLAKLTPNGTVCIYTLAETDIVIDINGYVPSS
jgi:hypothetical protein